MIRKTAVAGQFYPADPVELTASLQKHIPSCFRQREAHAVVVPHAGYQYSGDVAGSTYAAVRLPQHFIILCPNHRGLGAPISLISEGVWESPLGDAVIDSQMARRIESICNLVEENSLAHRDEHSVEVQIPFLQHLLNNDFSFVPIAIGTDRYENLVELGHALATAVTQSSEPFLLISSSDMNHFESSENTLKKDQLAIDEILELDSAGLYECIHRYNISMCGYAPTIAVIEAARQLGATGAELIRHTHSGEITGEFSSVVGYAGIVIH